MIVSTNTPKNYTDTNKEASLTSQLGYLMIEDSSKLGKKAKELIERVAAKGSEYADSSRKQYFPSNG